MDENIFTTIGVIKKGTLFVRMPKEAEKLGYSENDWIAITGIPPELKAYSSTHLIEVEMENKEIAENLEKLKKEFSVEKLKEALGLK
ncbi:MAG: hypothetical protein ABIK75_07030 [candidate division WOR-3 bacterium]